ncbi:MULTISPECIES: DegV family protein [Exiguobacterium]|uniref:DegV domain-containing protein SPy_1493/M5005_Spy1226 n=1 Tax=Exiguobacterium aurantiacum TaxID=33987 RepID=A0A377FYH9_9BACL|nr:MULTISPECIES: DegV family protein [Exiguobacterium]STO09614.1 DegV domain-containing protein SPy_1493/M5005_Spy1226 [Exiguobacterium aurantiacum]
MIKLLADSTCDLSDEILAKYEIGVAPLIVTIDNKSYEDRVDIQPDDLYGMLEALPEFPTTAMPSPATFMKLMEDAVEAGHDEILCICMSSGTSGSYQSAVLGKEYFEEAHPDSPVKIHIVDSRSMSHGSGWLLMKSAQMREAGATFEELVEFNEAYKMKVKHFLSVDDLDHLIKSGRISNAGAIIGKLLMVKPIMSMKNGKGAVVAKERGTRKVLKHYTDQFVKRCDKDITNFIIIGYTSDKKIAENLKAKIEAETDFDGDIYLMQMGVSVGTHVGLGAISMFFVEK